MCIDDDEETQPQRDRRVAVQQPSEVGSYPLIASTFTSACMELRKKHRSIAKLLRVGEEKAVGLGMSGVGVGVLHARML